MARVHIKLPDEGKGNIVHAEFTEDVENTIYPILREIFGISIMKSVPKLMPTDEFDNHLIVYDFEADVEDIELAAKVLAKITNNSIIKSIDVTGLIGDN